MPFGGGKGFWKVFADGIGGEAGPCGKEILFDGLSPGGYRWAEAGPM
jgi:hypothetical protein